jgi:hypothetical protein
VLSDITGRKTKITRIAFGVLLDLDQVDLDRAAFKFGFVGKFRRFLAIARFYL